MGIHDRHYNQDDGCSPTFGRSGGKSIVTILLIVNVVVFMVDYILTSGARVPRWMSPYFMGRFTIDEAVFGFQIWRVLTYQFLHGGFMHIIFNMIGLYFFGPMLEQWWGSRRFLAFYLLCGLGGVVPYTVLGLLLPSVFAPGASSEAVRGLGLIGASGAIYGILIGCAVLFPRQEVRLLFPPIPMKMRTLAMVFLVIAVLSVLAGTPNAGGELAHLGGALFGFLLIKKPGTLNFADRFSPQAIQDGYTKGRYERKLKEQQSHQAEVDRILAKVSEHGIQSLSKKEKKILQQDTDRLRGG